MFSREILYNREKIDCDFLVVHGWIATTDRREVINRPGIYAIFASHSGECLYVGKSKNSIWQRLVTNGNWDKALREFDKPVICFYETDGDKSKNILYLECLAIGLLEPKWNFDGSCNKGKSTISSNFISREEFSLLLAGEVSPRNRVILLLGYHAGLSPTDMCSIRWKDISLEKTRVYVSGQGRGFARYVPIDAEIVQSITAIKQSTDKVEDFVLKSCNGTPITRGLVHSIIKNAAKKAGVRTNVTACTLRNSYGLYLLEIGTEIKVIQERLGVKRFKALVHRSNGVHYI